MGRSNYFYPTILKFSKNHILLNIILLTQWDSNFSNSRIFDPFEVKPLSPALILPQIPGKFEKSVFQCPGVYSQKKIEEGCAARFSQNTYAIYDQNLRFSLPYLWPDQKCDTLFMTWLLDHKEKGFCCWLSLACVGSFKRGRRKQSVDGRRRACWRSSFF